MVSISCFKGNYNRFPVNFTFIQFEKYVKVILDSKAVILSNKQFTSNIQLFQIFKLSLLCTKDSSTIETENRYSYIYNNNKIYDNYIDVIDNYVYGVLTRRNWQIMGITDDYIFVPLEKSPKKNPLNMKEPKRESSNKKIRKFLKSLNDISINDPLMEIPNNLIEDFYMNECKNIFEYFNTYISYGMRFNVLVSINHIYGTDVMTSINKFL